ncbi:hypothetical protein ACKWRH_10815 [Bradyrhizobium sp. Pa8]|uniref:hypothetical protein n=1 Tax=Bradyrhizobium sp. Pa8 TaxID=3386552 RepID=UPI00403F83F6
MDKNYQLSDWVLPTDDPWLLRGNPLECDRHNGSGCRFRKKTSQCARPVPVGRIRRKASPLVRTAHNGRHNAARKRCGMPTDEEMDADPSLRHSEFSIMELFGLNLVRAVPHMPMSEMGATIRGLTRMLAPSGWPVLRSVLDASLSALGHAADAAIIAMRNDRLLEIDRTAVPPCGQLRDCLPVLFSDCDFELESSRLDMVELCASAVSS